MTDKIVSLDEALLRAATTSAAAAEKYWSNAEESGVAGDYDVEAHRTRKVFLDSLAHDGWVLQHGWQPIETAPKNGSSVLVSNGKYVYQAWWNAAPQIWNHEGDPSPCWTLFEPSDYYCAYHLNDDPPTYWMRLPAAPKTGD